LKLTRSGRDVLDGLLARERADLDQAALAAAYNEFDSHNSAFKQLLTDWQLTDGDTPNDHSDPAYDAAIVRRLGDLHSGFSPLLERLVAIAPRLQPYPARFAGALDRVRAGDHTWLARPMVDSYHTVWFELHEDLIGLGGLSRVDEAAAGRAK
jgi:pyruvate,orthophosphate dikinase